MKGPWLFLLASLLVASAQAARAELVLVYPIEDARRRDRLDEDRLFETLRLLHEKIEEDIAFETGQLDEDREPRCQSQRCQLDYGKAAAVEKVLSTSIQRLQDQCAVSSRLLDVTTGNYQHGATRITSCSPRGVADALDRVVASLSRQTRRAKGEELEDPLPESFAELDSAPTYDGSPVFGGKVGGLGVEPRYSAEDVGDCEGGKREACARAAAAADADADQEAVLRHGRRGCRLGDAPSCRWAIKNEHDRGRRKQALDLARRGCLELSDGASCGWAASIELAAHHTQKSIDYALRGCGFDDPDACSWAAKIEYEAGNLIAALEHTRRHCLEKRHGTSCRWAASIEHRKGSLESGLGYAKLGCEANDGASCSWAARIEYGLGDKALALSHAQKGVVLGDIDALGWVAKIHSELGYPDKALPPARLGCETHHNGVACSWAASVSFDQGDREGALEYAEIGASVGDLDCMSWLAKLEHERGASPKALSIATRGCLEKKHGSCCRWAATIGYQLGKRTAALKSARIGCEAGDGPSCSWVAKIEYETKKKHQALAGASRGCELFDADCCSWAAKIESEAHHPARALDFANRGCQLKNEDACGWVRSLEARERSLVPATEAEERR